MKALFGFFDQEVILLIGPRLIGLIHQLQILSMQ